jgi:ABC-2 type transport system permease protein
MAGLETTPWTQAQTRAQFAAILHLRGRIFMNGLRRKGGIGDLIARIVLLPIVAVIVIAPSVGAGLGAWYCVNAGHMELLPAILWAIFFLCQLISINLGQPATNFDPTQLIRFPLSFPGYAAIRLFFGLLSASNAVGTMMSLAVAIGVTVARPALAPYAFTVMFAFALANIFFTRMLFSWVDRWLSTRRAREVFTGLIFAFSLGIQYVNFTFNPGLNGDRHHSQAVTAARLAAARNLYHHVKPILSVLPPSLASNAIHAAQLGRPAAYFAGLAGVLAFAVLFLLIFATRIYKEFRGENLSEPASGVAKSPSAHPSPAEPFTASLASTAPLGRPHTLSTMLDKEFRYLRRNTGVFYSVVAPLVMVILFASRLAARTPVLILFPAAVAYTLMGIAPLCYNSLGVEAAGIQFYFMAPVRARDIFLAKNLMNFALAALEIVAVFATILYTTHVPSPALTIEVVLWAAFTMFITMAIGNRRSITSPKKIDLTKMGNKQASPLSALLSIGFLLLSGAAAAGFFVLAKNAGRLWLLQPAAVVLAIIGFCIYVRSLSSIDKLFADNRDTLSEALCKTN